MYQIIINKLDSSRLTIEAGSGSVLFVVGANGAGKSALMHQIYTQHKNVCRRILAHRKTWLRSGRLELTAFAKKQSEDQLQKQDVNFITRHQDNYAEQRSNLTIFELIDSENMRARRIAEAVDSNEVEKALMFSQDQAPIAIINELLAVSNMPIKISLGKEDELFASKNGSELYSIAELSDGERNAILIAADVLTAKANSLVVIDEPERHLHRSIISPLLSSLLLKRPDCAFVISTHDIYLPLDNEDASVLMVRGCEWNGKNPKGWDADLISAADDIDPGIKREILGSKRCLLFVEGDDQSLDKQIYQLLYPFVSVMPKGNCVAVERTVAGMTSAENLHWLSAVGLVDADDRTEEQICDLKNNGIYALPCYSIESLYYHEEIIRKVAARVSALNGEDADQMVNSAIDSIKSCVAPHKDRLCARLSEKKVRERVLAQLPDHNQISSGDPFRIEIDTQSILNTEKSRFDEAISTESVNSLVDRYPLRETPALNNVAKSLKFKTRKDYEASVRKLLVDDASAKELLRSLLADLTAKIFESVT